MNKVGDVQQEAQVTFQYTKDPLFRSAHADGFVGGLTPNGQIHLAFFSERSLLPKKHVYRVNPDGSLGSEIPEERAPNEPIVRDIQLDVLMSVQAAEGLKNWLDQYIRSLKSRAANSIAETKAPTSSGIAPLSAEIARAGVSR
jgi:hypothetical protein